MLRFEHRLPALRQVFVRPLAQLIEQIDDDRKRCDIASRTVWWLARRVFALAALDSI